METDLHVYVHENLVSHSELVAFAIHNRELSLVRRENILERL